MSKIRPLCILSVLLFTGCVKYVQTDVSQLKSTDRIRVELDQEQLALLRAFADNREGTVNGRFVEATADSVSMVVETPTAYQEVRIPRRSIIDTRLRKPDNKKSFVISVVLVGGIGALAAIGFEGRNNDPTGDDTGIDESRIPLFNFRLPFGFGFGGGRSP
jgi:hypothetical protein